MGTRSTASLWLTCHPFATFDPCPRSRDPDPVPHAVPFTPMSAGVQVMKRNNEPLVSTER